MQFTKELSLRLILDYYDLLPNKSLIEGEEDKQFEFDALITYLVNPFTALYVGYNSGFENFDDAKVAREIAEEYFDSDKILKRLIDISLA